jgi:lysophospholipase L1-like esterase
LTLAAVQIILFGAINPPPSFSPGSLTAVEYWLDAGTISGVADGATIAAANWMDQSKSNLGALATATDVIYRATGWMGKPAVEFNGSTSVAVSPALSVATPRRIFAVLKYLGAVAAGSQDQKYILDGAALDQGSIIFDSGSIGAGGYAAIDGDTLHSAQGLFANLNNVGYLVDAVVNGASSSIQMSGQPAKVGNFTHAATYTAMTLGAPGNQLSGYFGNFQLAELILCDSTLTSGQASQIRSYLDAKHSIVTQNFLLCDGNSITYGTGSTGGTNGWPVQIASMLNNGGALGWYIVNNGVAGQTTPQMDTQASPGGGAQTTDIRLGWYGKTIVTGWEVTNDLATNNVSAAIGYSNLVTFFNHRRAANAAAKLVVATVLPANIITGVNETSRQTINTNIRANWASFADALVDVAAIAQLQDPNNTIYFADGTHPTDAGYALIAQAFASAVNSFG